MYCTKCGKQNDSNARFCTGCGAILQQNSRPAGSGAQRPAGAAGSGAQKPAGMTGSGTENLTGSNGFGPQKPEGPNGNDTDKTGSGSKKPLLLIIIIAVVAALAVVVVFAWQKGLFSGSKGEQTQDEVSVEEELSAEEEVAAEEELSAEEENIAEEEPETAAEAEYELTFETTSLTFTSVGSTETISFTTNIEETLEIMWSSMDETVATVDENGTVTAVGSGVTIVTATWQNLEAECTVTCEIETPDVVQITGLSATATSQLGNQSGKNYKPANLFDGDLSTAYVEGVSGVGSGETIYITLDGEYYIDEIDWYPGYQASSSLLSKNGYPTRLTFYFSDGSSVESSVNGTPTLGTSVSVPVGGVLTDSIEVVIESAVAGSKYDDTCISEMEIYGWTNP